MKHPQPFHAGKAQALAARKQFTRDNVRAAWLRAKHKQITARIAAIEAAKEQAA